MCFASPVWLTEVARYLKYSWRYSHNSHFLAGTTNTTARIFVLGGASWERQLKVAFLTCFVCTYASSPTQDTRASHNKAVYRGPSSPDGSPSERRLPSPSHLDPALRWRPELEYGAGCLGKAAWNPFLTSQRWSAHTRTHTRTEHAVHLTSKSYRAMRKLICYPGILCLVIQTEALAFNYQICLAL